MLASTAAAGGTPVFKVARWRRGGAVVPAAWADYQSVATEVNVLAYVTQFVPMEVIRAAPKGSICYHPSLLPRHRGGSAINWTLMHGDPVTGFTVFWPDDGLDTGPIVLQRTCVVEPNDTVSSLYKRFLFPEGVKGMMEAVDAIAAGTVTLTPQPTEGASYEPLWRDPEQARVNWAQPAKKLHDFIRGNDRVPGAWAVLDGQRVTLYGSSYVDDTAAVEGEPVAVEQCDRPAVATSSGLVVFGADGKKVLVRHVKLADGKIIPASSCMQALRDARQH